MANQSIRAAFERLWQQIIVKLGNYSTTDHTHSYAGSSSAGGEATSAITLTGNQIGVTTAGTGAAYTATVSGITSLTSGVSFIMIPHTISTTTTPTLNVNGLGAKNIKRRLSNMGTSVQAGYTNTWLAANTPFRVVYDGMQWIVEGMEKPAAADLYGLTATITELNYTDGVTSNIQEQLNTRAKYEVVSEIETPSLTINGVVPVEKGGTNASDAATALANLGGASIVKVWENASPESAFAAQTFNLNDTGDLYIFLFKNSADNDVDVGIITKYGNSARTFSAADSSTAYIYTRRFTISEDGTVDIYDCYRKVMGSTTTATTPYNNYLIFKAVYVIKNIL